MDAGDGFVLAVMDSFFLGKGLWFALPGRSGSWREHEYRRREPGFQG
jgi:hypothetical protein